jgi:hypothetical protein
VALDATDPTPAEKENRSTARALPWAFPQCGTPSVRGRFCVLPGNPSSHRFGGRITPITVIVALRDVNRYMTLSFRGVSPKNPRRYCYLTLSVKYLGSGAGLIRLFPAPPRH